MTVLIAGCGDLGTEVGLRFITSGSRVHGLRRSPQKLPESITGIGVDLSQEVPAVPPDTEVVVVATSADQRTEGSYRSSYTDALSNLLDGLDRSRARPRRVLLVSSTSVYGTNENGWVDEHTPTAPTSETAQILSEAELLLQHRVPHAITLRLAGIYGPGRTRLIDQVRTGRSNIDDPDRYTNRIHRDDAAAAIVHLTTMRDRPDLLYIGVDREPSARGEVLRFLAHELGVPPPQGGAGKHGTPTGKRCRNSRLAATGFRYRYPTFREGYRAVLAGSGTRHR